MSQVSGGSSVESWNPDLGEHGSRDGETEHFYDPDDPTPFPVDKFPPDFVVHLHQRSDVDSSWSSQHHTLGPRANQAAPGNHIHDGGTSKGFSWQQFQIPSNFWASVGNPQPSIGSGTISARYVKLGTLVIYHFEINFAANTVLGTAEWLFKLPFPARPAVGNSSLAACGVVKGYNGVTNVNHVGGMWLSGPDQISIVSENWNDSWGPAIPTAWNSDPSNHFNGTITYESIS